LALTIFVLTFVKFEWGLYILIFSMLLSPEIRIGDTGSASLERGITLRLEDFLLIIIGFSWFVKNAIHKELGLVLKTPLNKAILFYILSYIISTLLGVMDERVSLKSGGLHALKYLEYFIIYFMVVNHVKDQDQVKRFVFCFLLTCCIISIFGILQIPGGERVSAPFEGERGEPNTLGGYLLFIGAIATGLFITTEDSKWKHLFLILIIIIIPPFLFTQSRSSYLGLLPVCLILGLFSKRRIIIMGMLIISFLMSPLFLPSQVKDRILFTISQPEAPGQITVGDFRLDTSTSARIDSLKEVMRDWPEHPLIGYGVTGYHFVDAQYPRVLIESGILGLTAFFYLLYSIFRLSIEHLRAVKTPFLKGLSYGFLAGYVGLLFHAIGANTFIIVRIMEPFWFFAGIIAVLPTLEREQQEQPQENHPRIRRFASAN
jgi:O-antigen ligase